MEAKHDPIAHFRASRVERDSLVIFHDQDDLIHKLVWKIIEDVKTWKRPVAIRAEYSENHPRLSRFSSVLLEQLREETIGERNIAIAIYQGDLMIQYAPDDELVLRPVPGDE